MNKEITELTKAIREYSKITIDEIKKLTLEEISDFLLEIQIISTLVHFMLFSRSEAELDVIRQMVDKKTFERTGEIIKNIGVKQ